MNERIKQLAEQAGLEFDDDEALEFGKQIYYVTKEDMEKFAELIVRECAEQIIEQGTDWIDFSPSRTGVRPEYWNMSQHIKKHFGVEE